MFVGLSIIAIEWLICLLVASFVVPFCCAGCLDDYKCILIHYFASSGADDETNAAAGRRFDAWGADLRAHWLAEHARKRQERNT